MAAPEFVRRATFAAVCATLALAANGVADARITGIQVTSTTPAFNGTSFDNVGPYENVIGVAHGELDPDDPLNAVITDIDLAPRNARGAVEYSMDFSIFKPVDESKGNHTLLYDVVNRGRMSIPALDIGSNGSNPGDGFLEKSGYTIVYSGWEHDVTSGIKITPVIAHNNDGSSIIGRVRSEYILTSPASTQDVTAPPAYEAVSTDNTGATLTMRVHQFDPKVLIPNTAWSFGDCSTTPFPGSPSTLKVCLKSGFDTNHIYELLYTAKNPVVTGIGFAATRDFLSYLRNSNGRKTGTGNGVGNGDGRGRCNNRGQGAANNGCPQLLPTPSSLLGNAIDNAIIYGSSQSGRWIRTFLQLGFNQDENLHLVVEGAIPHKASNRGAFNVRWGQPTRLSGTQHTETQFPGQESPQTWGVYADTISDVTASQLDRCNASNSCPKIFHTITDTEYWQALMALNTTTTDGTQDLVIPDNVRIYQFSNTQHGGGDPLNLPTIIPNPPVNCQLSTNPNPFIPAQRALLVALRDWIVNGAEPPPSLYSNVGDGTLAPVETIHYGYTGGTFTTQVANRKFYLDRGAAFNVQDISGVMAEPPVTGAAYALLVPAVNSDGNDLGGLRNVNVQVPLGTYTGWNPRKAGFSEGDSCDLTGGYIPFFRTQAQRVAAGDPRPSLAERYPTHADYVAKVTAAANSLVAQRVLLPQDAALMIQQANTAVVP